jgi:hypothetical protein
MRFFDHRHHLLQCACTLLAAASYLIAHDIADAGTWADRYRDIKIAKATTSRQKTSRALFVRSEARGIPCLPGWRLTSLEIN